MYPPARPPQSRSNPQSTHNAHAQQPYAAPHAQQANHGAAQWTPAPQFNPNQQLRARSGVPGVKSAYVRLLVFGVLLMLLGSSCEALGIGMAVSPNKPTDVATGWFFAAFALIVLILPAAILIGFGAKSKQRINRFHKLAGLAAASVRLPFSTIQTDLRMPLSDVRAFVLEALANGTLRGRLDIEEGIFISAAADTTIYQSTTRCNHCGANVTVFVVPGQTPTCAHCRSALR
jgi:hypothetical protein